MAVKVCVHFDCPPLSEERRELYWRWLNGKITGLSHEATQECLLTVIANWFKYEKLGLTHPEELAIARDLLWAVEWAAERQVRVSKIEQPTLTGAIDTVLAKLAGNPVNLPDSPTIPPRAAVVCPVCNETNVTVAANPSLCWCCGVVLPGEPYA